MPDNIAKFLSPEVMNIVKVLMPVIGGYIAAKLSHKLIILVRRFVTKKTPTDFDDRIMAVLEKNLGRILMLGGLYLGIQSFKRVMSQSGEASSLVIVYSEHLLYVISVFVITLLVTKLFSEVLSWYVEKLSGREHKDVVSDFYPLISRVLNVTIFAVAFISVLDHFGQDISALVVSLGVGSLAIALAAQETLANMISGFVIMIDRPFRVGDRVLLDSGERGDVHEIGLRSTKILDRDNQLIIMPNAEIVKGKIVNQTYPEPTLRVRIYVGVAYGTDLVRAKKIMYDAAIDHNGVLNDPVPLVFLMEFGDSSLNLRLTCRIRDFVDEHRVAEQLRHVIYDRFNAENIEIPFPQRVITINKDDGEKE